LDACFSLLSPVPFFAAPNRSLSTVFGSLLATRCCHAYIKVPLPVLFQRLMTDPEPLRCPFLRSARREDRVFPHAFHLSPRFFSFHNSPFRAPALFLASPSTGNVTFLCEFAEAGTLRRFGLVVYNNPSVYPSFSLFCCRSPREVCIEDHSQTLGSVPFNLLFYFLRVSLYLIFYSF